MSRWMPLAELLKSSDRGRAAELAAFAGCVLGGSSEHLDQGNPEVLIYAAGVWLSQTLVVPPLPPGAHPMVLADPALLDSQPPGTVLAAHEYPPLIQHLQHLTGGAIPAPDLVAVSADMPREHFTEAEICNPGTAQQGVLGAAGTMNGVPCILTAGHAAAPNATQPVGPGNQYKLLDAAGLPAPVVFASHAGTTTGRVKAADIAIVELTAHAGRDPQIKAPGTPYVDDDLIRLGGSNIGNGGAPYRGLCAWVRVDQRLGLWGDVYMTDQQIGTYGDSGSAVVDRRGQLVGHYLGATSGNGFVQRLRFQLPAGCIVP